MKNAETRTKVLSCEFGQTFKNNYFEEHLRTATSVEALLFFLINLKNSSLFIDGFQLPQG